MFLDEMRDLPLAFVKTAVNIQFPYNLVNVLTV